MNVKTTPPTSGDSHCDWRTAFEVALLERDQSVLPRRLRDAKNAVMDRIEDSRDSASLSERRLLLAALNTITELQRLAQVEELPPAESAFVSREAA
jgi:hypothetical protein